MPPTRTRTRPPAATRSTLTEDEFFAACLAIGQDPNPEQRDAIRVPASADLHIVAGPGTGKTSSLTLRILKCVLVDGLRPSGIVATTFTVKAAAELRSRLLTRGFALVEHIAADERLPAAVRERAARLDINQIVTNTVDGLCQQVLRDHREPGTTNPVIVDEFVAATLMLREGLFDGARHRDADLDQYLLDLNSNGNRFGWNTGRKRDVLRTVWDRRFQDQVAWEDYCDDAPPGLAESIASYHDALAEREMVDFAMLEQTVLERLRAGRLDAWAQSVQAIFVDEYQDTNLLQESLYFALAARGGGSLTIVGDDDQSLYRFRGATVDLFRDFPDRCAASLARPRPRTIFLRRNYRSTPSIVTFVNNYAALDPGYQAARVAGKPPLIPRPGAAADPPILAMFRSSAESLADDLAGLLSDVFQGRGYRLPNGDRLRVGPGGAIGDAALLCASPNEADFGGRRRLPGLLRDALGDLPQPLQVFNPRGQDLADAPLIGVFGGLLLETIDPDEEAEAAAARSIGDAAAVFAAWRAAAQAELARRPDLAHYHAAWAARRPRRGTRWPRSVPCLKLIYALAHYFPELHDDPEGQIFLEVFTRQLGACDTLGTYRGDILAAPATSQQILNSKKELLNLFLAPIASGGEVNEELIEAFPRNRLPVLSIHQAKGLEFPLVIVDVGADFRSRHHAHAFKRFPSDGSLPHRLEDCVRAHSPLAPPARSAVDRAFDDLYRQYFVAFSRPESILILAGLEGVDPRGGIANVATGARRNGVNPWARRAPFVRI